MDPLQAVLAAHPPTLEALDEGDLDAATVGLLGEMSSAPLPQPREPGAPPADVGEAVDREIYAALVHA